MERLRVGDSGKPGTKKGDLAIALTPQAGAQLLRPVTLICGAGLGFSFLGLRFSRFGRCSLLAMAALLWVSRARIAGSRPAWQRDRQELWEQRRQRAYTGGWATAVSAPAGASRPDSARRPAPIGCKGHPAPTRIPG